MIVSHTGGLQSTFQFTIRIFPVAQTPRKPRNNFTKIKELRFKRARPIRLPVV